MASNLLRATKISVVVIIATTQRAYYVLVTVLGTSHSI